MAQANTARDEAWVLWAAATKRKDEAGATMLGAKYQFATQVRGERAATSRANKNRERQHTLDTKKLQEALLGVVKKLIATPSLFLSEIHMMSLFSCFMDKLPPFGDYMRTLFDKQMLVVDKTTGLRVNHMRAARDELFHPTTDTNNKCTPRMLEIISKGMRR